MTGGASHDSSREDSDLVLSDLGMPGVARLAGEVACEHQMEAFFRIQNFTLAGRGRLRASALGFRIKGFTLAG